MIINDHDAFRVRRIAFRILVGRSGAFHSNWWPYWHLVIGILHTQFLAPQDCFTAYHLSPFYCPSLMIRRSAACPM
jgi:hypothetical protein